AVRAEFLGTLLLVYFGCGATLAVAPSAPGCEGGAGDPALTVALAFGLAVAVITQCTGHASGAHLNPALSLAMLATGRISAARALFYTLAQIVGGLSGSGLLIGVARQRLSSAAATEASVSNETSPVAVGPVYFLPTVASDTHPGQAFGAEFMATFVYAFATFACMEPRRPVELGCRSVIVGLAVAMGHLVSGKGLREAAAWERSTAQQNLVSCHSRPVGSEMKEEPPSSSRGTNSRIASSSANLAERGETGRGRERIKETSNEESGTSQSKQLAASGNQGKFGVARRDEKTGRRRLPLSGAGLNPVRCLGPALLTGSWRHHWLYWAGPLLGGLAGGLTCEYAQDSRSELHYLRRSLLLRGIGRGGGLRTGGNGGGGGGGGSEG
uniref:Aquaporin n=1 Tax=Macrostomum lignano TaxID=282301 RepID=A0A1I8HX72_9PLAT